MQGLHFSSEPAANEAIKNLIRDPLDEANMVITGWRDYHPVAIFLRDEERRIQGGIFGYTWGRWLHVENLWVAEAFRGQGYGSRLLEAAEGEARDHGCEGAYLETFDFQAPEFYKRHGYEVFGQLPDFPPGHTQYYLRKAL